MPEKQHSKSQLLRFALYDLWSAKIGAGKMPFEEFYAIEMDKIIEGVRAEAKVEQAFKDAENF